MGDRTCTKDKDDERDDGENIESAMEDVPRAVYLWNQGNSYYRIRFSPTVPRWPLPVMRGDLPLSGTDPPPAGVGKDH